MIAGLLKSGKAWRSALAGVGLGGGAARIDESGKSVAAYWTRHNVTSHAAFGSAAESLEYFHWRNDQYFPYIELMPVSGCDGQTVLDYGCGPGHDLVGFAHYSKPRRLIGMDVSPTSLGEAEARLALHGARAELVRLDPESAQLPLDSASVDHVHASGVIHHLPDPLQTLRELRRVLRRGGTANVMVYNHDSLWLHFYVAYRKRIVEGRYSDLSLRDAFARSTDGEDCPISRVYRPEEFVELCRAAGFAAECRGAAISMPEASLFHGRYDAIADRRLPAESRRFLLALEVDRFGFPTYRGRYAGVDGCYRLRVPD